MDVGMESVRKRSSVWMRDGDPVKWVIATGRAHKGVTSTNANMPSHTHTHKMSDCSPCVPAASFPCNAPDHTSSAHWKHSVAPICFASLYLGFWVMGNPCHKGAALVLTGLFAPGGGSLSHEYPFTGATLLIKS